jgi:hypothetical protein
MSAIGRWTSVDPAVRGNPAGLLKNNSRLLTVSPYDYTYGNPINLRDPDGRVPRCCVFTVDVTFRVQSFLPSNSGSVGVAADLNGNVAVYATGGGGAGPGIGLNLEGGVGVYPTLNDVSELKGHGFNIEGYISVGKSGTVQMSTSGLNPKIELSAGVGIGLGVFSEHTRTIMAELTSRSEVASEDGSQSGDLSGANRETGSDGSSDPDSFETRIDRAMNQVVKEYRERQDERKPR